MAREIDPTTRPGFCSVCFCEKCMRGFYQAQKSAIKFVAGHYVCSENGCAGDVRTTPLLNWKRLTPCKDGCARLRREPQIPA